MVFECKNQAGMGGSCPMITLGVGGFFWSMVFIASCGASVLAAACFTRLIFKTHSRKMLTLYKI